MTFGELARGVREQLGGQEHRYRHVVRVARLAERLAMRHGLAPARARVAGMLHDLARLYPAPQLLDEARRRKLEIDDFSLRNPIVLHAPLSAAIAREAFGIADDGVLSAIAKHTLASPEMSPLDEIVYLADGLEPGRDFAERARLEALAFRDLRAAMGAVLDSTLDHQRRRGLEQAPQTLAARRRYGAERSLLPA